MSNEQISPFQNPDDPKRVISPSEEFRLAHPDYVEPEVARSEWDPNARRANRQRGSGGGFASATAGEIKHIPVDGSQASPTSTFEEEPIAGKAPQYIKEQVDKLAKPTNPSVMDRFLERQRERYGPK